MIGEKVGNCRITRLIGKGGFATVYEAEHETLGLRAIKILNPTFFSDSTIRDRFKREARKMANFDHPNITRVFEFYETDQYLAIIMELMMGEDLAEWVKRNGPLQSEHLKSIFKKVLDACQYMHDIGVVHRDIKPANIFLLNNGQVKVLDFGISKIQGQISEVSLQNTQVGTPMYMSPEQVKNASLVDHRSDIYSLGVTFLYALAGKTPYDPESESIHSIQYKIVYEPLPILDNQGIWTNILLKACHKDVNLRFQNCSEWSQLLDNPELLVVSKPGTEEAERDPNSPQKTDRRKRKRWALASLLILIMVSSISYLKWGSTDMSPVNEPVYSNIKARNKILLCCMFDEKFDSNLVISCFKSNFGDREIEYVKLRRSGAIVEAFRNRELDVLILHEPQKEKFDESIDFGTPIVWEGHEKNVYFAMPFGNEEHLKNIINCVEN